MNLSISKVSINKGVLGYPSTRKGIVMKITSIMLSLAALLFTTNVSAEETCSSSPYKLIDNTFKFGMTRAQAAESIVRAYGSKGFIVPNKDLVIFKFTKPVKNLEAIAALIVNNKVVRIMYTYDEGFMRSLGGLVPSFKLLFGKLNEKYGTPNGSNPEDGRVWWSRPGQDQMTLIGKEPMTLQVRFDCDSLEEIQRKKQADSVEFGI